MSRRSIITTKAKVGRAAWNMEGRPGHTLPMHPMLSYGKHRPGNRKKLADYLRKHRKVL